jgi:hypothetical protein
MICASNEIQVVLLHHLFCFSKFYFTLQKQDIHVPPDVKHIVHIQTKLLKIYENVLNTN